MKPVGIFFGSTSGMTQKSALKIQQAFGKNVAKVFNLKTATVDDMKPFSNLIFGTSAWGIGEMQDEWEMTIDHLSSLDFSEKKVALFGLGDQKEYPESFVDGLGTLYCRFPEKSCVVGFWPVEGYDYYFSLADKDGQFVGLALDDHNQEDLSEERISKWVEQLKTEFI
ncbi:MAG: flavodoxin [Bacteroidetes bacterium CG18_big_fil_WC_8_21_14_2_50_41_14]|nr:MAG: flavodoxin [Bacteroidetes bacterium CG18_big_fil_WC_8_21_14_2_50_41_14]PJB60062.1 MAG: flavodoxin [Bacteroidetes bacterium CG_4_9_14_3_um_filter_41_19]